MTENKIAASVRAVAETLSAGMAHPISRSGTRSHGPPREHASRMLVKDGSAKTGYVDGAWWPHSDDLAAELAAVLPSLAARLGAIRRVTYRIDEWASVPDEFDFAGQVVLLDGYRHGTAHTVEVSGPRNRRLVLLVISPDTAADRASSILTFASSDSNESTVDELLTTGPREPVSRDAASGRWRREREARRPGRRGGARKERS